MHDGRVRRRAFMLPRVDGVELAEAFLVSAVATVLLIRAYLSATGYPQVGTDGLHIAHVLWGGLLMLVGLLLLVLRLGRPALRLGAVLSGVGFGFFIDEIGKFVTSDVNYFFEPAIAMIYVVFVAIAIVLAVVRHRVRIDSRSALANAMALYDLAVHDPAANDARTEVLALLDRCDPSDPVVPVMRRGIEQAIATAPSVPPTWWQRLRVRVLGAYDRASRTPWFPRVVLVLFAVIAVGTLVLTVPVFAEPGDISVPEWLQVGGSLAAAALIVAGLASWRSSRVRAYRWFERAIIVDILVTEVFTFYNAPLAATVTLAVDIALLIALRIAGRHEAIAASG